MHELGIIQGVITSACAVAEEHGASSISEIRLKVGSLSQAFPDALEFAFEALAPEYELIKNARLTIEYIQAQSECSECHVRFKHEPYDFSCPECGSVITTLLAGKELHIDSLEIEHEDEDAR